MLEILHDRVEADRRCGAIVMQGDAEVEIVHDGRIEGDGILSCATIEDIRVARGEIADFGIVVAVTEVDIIGPRIDRTGQPDVIPCAAVKRVLAEAAVDDIRAIAAVDKIIAATGEDRIVTAIAIDGIGKVGDLVALNIGVTDIHDFTVIQPIHFAVRRQDEGRIGVDIEAERRTAQQGQSVGGVEIDFFPDLEHGNRTGVDPSAEEPEGVDFTGPEIGDRLIGVAAFKGKGGRAGVAAVELSVIVRKRTALLGSEVQQIGVEQGAGVQGGNAAVIPVDIRDGKFGHGSKPRLDEGTERCGDEHLLPRNPGRRGMNLNIVLWLREGLRGADGSAFEIETT